MLHTSLCDLLGIEYPIIQASLGPWSSVELAAAVSNAGAIGSLGTALKSIEELKQDFTRIRQLTERPFIINHTMRPFSQEAFDLTLRAHPRVISLALGEPGDLPKQAHDAGSLFMQQVNTVRQAYQAAERGADIIVAQGTEAGGFSGTVSTLTLLPQVVDAVKPLPVVAAGGIADGRGIAVALLLGAQGVNLGTRFLASEELPISSAWKQRIVEAASEEAVKVEFAGAVFPPLSPGGYAALPRVLKTPFVEEWNLRLAEVEQEAGRLSQELVGAIRQGRGHELVPFTGQSVGLINEVLPVAQIIEWLMSQAEETLLQAGQLVS